jgi:hypothetical protein
MDVKGKGKIISEGMPILVKVTASVEMTKPARTQGTVAGTDELSNRFIEKWNRSKAEHEIMVTTENETRLKLKKCSIVGLSPKGSSFRFRGLGADWLGWDKS